MFYDPKWDKPEGEVDPFNIDTLIAWLQKKPAYDTYNYTNCRSCMLAEYFREYGFWSVDVDYATSVHGNKPLPAGWDNIASNGYNCLNPEANKKGKNYMSGWTYGKALARAKALKAA